MTRLLAKLLPAIVIFWRLAADSAQAAEIQARSENGAVEISVVGELKLEDGEKFANIAGPIRQAIVIFDSPGGALLAGLRIGEIARDRNFVTVIPDGARCASACAVAWLGGVKRFLGHHSLLGFHAAYDNTTGAEVGEGNAILGAYLAHLGLSYDAIASVTAAGPTEMNWLDAAEASRIGIETQELPETRKFGVSETAVSPPQKNQNAITLEGRAVQFALHYFAKGSSSSESALDFDRNVYADSVIYYGTIRTRQEVLVDKERFVKRWPERLYIPQSSTISVNCNQDQSTCAIDGKLTYECRSYSRGAYSAGISSFSLTISLQSSGARIIGENGRVVERL